MLLSGKFLKGVRILDLSWLVAGPSGTLLLALAGADVIRVESARSLDNFRRSFIQDGDPDKSYLFATVNMGKRSVTIDVKSPAGLDLIKQLAAKCDVIVENFSPGTMTRLGLGYADLAREHPRLVMVSASAAGQSGPKSRFAGYAPHFGALGGLASLTGYRDGPPHQFGRSLDSRVGVHLALAVVTGLLRRDRLGVGSYLDLSAQEVVASQIGDITTAASVSGEDSSRDGNRRPGVAGNDVYPCQGLNQWVMIEMDGDADWASLCPVISRPELASDARFADGYQRWLHRDLVDSAIAGWTAGNDKWTVVNTLQAVGIKATPVLDAADLYGDDHLNDRDLWHMMDHPALGRINVMGSPIKWPVQYQAPNGIEPGPLLGEDTVDVLQEVLDLKQDEIAALKDAGALT